MKELLRVENLTLTLKRDTLNSVLVKDISFGILPGECLSLIGESGSGKSLSSLAITGLLPDNIKISNGKIIFEEKIISLYTSTEYLKIRGSEIAMIFQEPMTALNPVFTVGEQIRETLANYYSKQKKPMPPKDIYLEALGLLEQVQINDPKRIYNQYPFELSGGLRQRVMIAIAICCSPKLLIADEPTTALDVTTQKEILNLLKEICKKKNMSLLLITHDFGIVSHYADRVCVMNQGSLVETNDVKKILSSPQKKYTQGLLKAIPRIEKKYQRKERLYSEVAIGSEGSESSFLEDYKKKSASMFSKEAKNPNSNILTIKNLKVYYPVYKGILRKQINTIKAIDDISFSVKRGSIFGIVGESGCGKSTLAKTLVRLEKVIAGELHYQDTNYTFLKHKELFSIRKDIQIIFQDSFSAFNPRMTVLEILSEPLRLNHKGYTKKHYIEECKKLLDLVALDLESLYRYPHEFSGGQRQRLSIARALAMKPRILIADESVSALDVSIQAQILNLLKDIQQKLNLTILFISHDLAVIKYMCEEMIVLYQGKIVEKGNTEEIISNPREKYTEKLLSSNLKLKD